MDFMCVNALCYVKESLHTFLMLHGQTNIEKRPAPMFSLNN